MTTLENSVNLEINLEDLYKLFPKNDIENNIQLKIDIEDLYLYLINNDIENIKKKLQLYPKLLKFIPTDSEFFYYYVYAIANTENLNEEDLNDLNIPIMIEEMIEEIKNFHELLIDHQKKFWDINSKLNDYPMFLEYLNGDLNIDKRFYSDFVNTAIKSNALALQYVDKNNLDLDFYESISKSAFEKNSQALQFADNLKNDLNFIINEYIKNQEIEEYKKNHEILKYASEEIRNDYYFFDDKKILDCDNENANFTNNLGTCWMISIFTMFIFGNLTRNHLQNKLIYKIPTDIITESKELLKHLIPYAFNEYDINVIFKIFLKKFIDLLNDRLHYLTGPEHNQSISANTCNYEDELYKLYKNIFISKIEIDKYGSLRSHLESLINNEYSLSNLLSILFLNKFADLVSFPNLNLSLEYSFRNINSSTTVGYQVSIPGHAVGFFKCKNKLKLVNNNNVINFDYYEFLEIYIIRKKLYEKKNYDENYKYSLYLSPELGFIIKFKKKLFLFTDKVSNFFNIEIQDDLESIDITIEDKIYTIINSGHIRQIQTIKLTNKFKKRKDGIFSPDYHLVSNLLFNSLILNDDLFDLIVKNYDEETINKHLKNIVFDDDLEHNTNPKFILAKFEVYLKNNKLDLFEKNLEKFNNLYDEDNFKTDFKNILDKLKDEIDQNFLNHEFIKKIIDQKGGYNKCIYKIKYIDI